MDSIKNKTWFKFASNKYVLVLLVFIVWMLFLDNYSYLDHRLLNNQIDELNRQKEYYKKEISNDQINIKQLKDPAQIEKYAREKYFRSEEHTSELQSRP